MKLLLDQGLPHSTVFQFGKAGVEATHVSDRGLATARDVRILELAKQDASVVVTLDADFHALLAHLGGEVSFGNSHQDRRSSSRTSRSLCSSKF